MARKTVPTCAYVLVPASQGVDAVYCGKPVSYTMKADEDGTRYRTYEPFCPRHTQPDDSDDWTR